MFAVKDENKRKGGWGGHFRFEATAKSTHKILQFYYITDIVKLYCPSRWVCKFERRDLHVYKKAWRMRTSKSGSVLVVKLTEQLVRI